MSTAALNVARTGLDAQAERMRVIANNLANVNTTGFQRERAEFQTLSYQTITTPGAASSGESRYAIGLSLGSGVRMTGVARQHSQGPLNSTENPYDMAIQGEGFFQVQKPDGTTAYTRAGNFQVSPEGQIVTSDGYPLQPDIRVPEGVQSITVGTDGKISAQVQGQTEASEVGQIELARFANPAGLLPLGDNLYQATTASGEAQTGAAGAEGRGVIRQGTLEGSNVNVVQELVDMIETQRAYEVNSKMVQSTDEMLRNANQQL